MNEEIKLITLNSFIKHGFKVTVTNAEVNNNIITEYSLNKPSIIKNWTYLIVWHTENNQITISTHIINGFEEAIVNNKITKDNIDKYIKKIYQGNVTTELELENILNKYISKKKQQKKTFDYNDKLMSLTKQKIININKNLYETINFMQKDIDLLKKTNDEYYELDIKLIETTIKLNQSLKEEIKYIDKCTKYAKQNTTLFKELLFLKNRSLFKRIFNVQYKTNEN